MYWYVGRTKLRSSTFSESATREDLLTRSLQQLAALRIGVTCSGAAQKAILRVLATERKTNCSVGRGTDGYWINIRMA